MEKELEELRNIPDKFNSLYLERGWSYFERMNFNSCKQKSAISYIIINFSS